MLKGKLISCLLRLLLSRVLPSSVPILDCICFYLPCKSSVSDILRLRGADSLILNHPDTPSAQPHSHTSTSLAPSADPSASHWNDIFDNLSF